jgi:hypothetical protein
VRARFVLWIPLSLWYAPPAGLFPAFERSANLIAGKVLLAIGITRLAADFSEPPGLPLLRRPLPNRSLTRF